MVCSTTEFPTSPEPTSHHRYQVDDMKKKLQELVAECPRSGKKGKILSEQGLSEAENDLGVMDGEGQGVSEDYKEAVKWWRLAAEQGSAEAQSKIRRYNTLLRKLFRK